MIAAVEHVDRFCIVRWIGQLGFLKVMAVAYCNVQTNAADGVTQLPDALLEKPMPGIRDQKLRPCCPRCKAAFLSIAV